jgi:hypothetical protein
VETFSAIQHACIYLYTFKQTHIHTVTGAFSKPPGEKCCKQLKYTCLSHTYAYVYVHTRTLITHICMHSHRSFLESSGRKMVQKAYRQTRRGANRFSGNGCVHISIHKHTYTHGLKNGANSSWSNLGSIYLEIDVSLYIS